MSYLHKRMFLDQGDVVVVECSHQVNVLVIDDQNYASYRRGDSFRYHGGFFSHFPARVPIAETKNWNVVVSLPPERRATIRASINVLGGYGR
jgi:hypothetical protein